MSECLTAICAVIIAAAVTTALSALKKKLLKTAGRIKEKNAMQGESENGFRAAEN